MTERIDHAAKARYWLPAKGDGITPNHVAVAQVHATLALVEQQRIANLIALGNAEHGPYRYLDAGRTGLMSMDAYGAAAVLLGIELKEESK